MDAYFRVEKQLLVHQWLSGDEVGEQTLKSHHFLIQNSLAPCLRYRPDPE